MGQGWWAVDGGDLKERYLFQFPKSNIRLILQKIRDRARPAYKQFVAEQLGGEALRSGRVSFKALRRALFGLLGDQVGRLDAGGNVRESCRKESTFT